MGRTLPLAGTAVVVAVSVSWAQPSDVLKRAQEMIETGRTAEAVRTLEGVVKTRQDLEEAWYLLGKAKYLEGDLEGAERALKESRKVKPDFVLPVALLSGVYEKQKRWDEALRMADEALRLDPRNGLLHTRRAGVLLVMGRTNEAEAAFLKGWESDRGLAEALLQAARIRMNRRRYGEALALLVSAEKDVQGEVRKAWEGLAKECRFVLAAEEGERLWTQNRYAAALAKYEEALSYRPDASAVLVKAGQASRALKDVRKAEEYLRRAVEADPKNGAAWGWRAVLLLEGGRTVEAASNIGRAMALDAGQAAWYRVAGQVYETLGDDARALRLYRQAASLDPADRRVWERSGFLLAQERRWDEAVSALETALRLGAGDEVKSLLVRVRAAALLEEGNALFEQGRYKEAAEAYGRSLDLRKDPVVLVNKANAHLAAAEPEKALALLRPFEAERSPPLPALEALAVAYLRTGRTAEAETLRRRMEEAGKANREAWMASAGLHRLNGAWSNAEAALRKALALSGDEAARQEVRRELAALWVSAGHQAWNRGDYGEAKRRYERALGYDGESVAAKKGVERAREVLDTGRLRQLMAEGKTLFERKDYAAAADRYRRALELREDLKDLHYNLGQCHHLLGNAALAESHARQYLAARPGDVDGVVLLASVLEETGRTEEARRVLASAMAAGGNAAFHHLTGRILEREGRKREAAESYWRAVGSDPSFLDARIALGNLYYGEKEYSKAQEQYEEVLRRDPKNDAGLYNLGFIYMKKNRWREALDLFAKAETVIPDYGPLHFHMARCYYQTGDYEKALRHGSMAGQMSGVESVPVLWGLANIHVRLYQVEQDGRKKEEWRRRAVELCEACIASTAHPEISVQARSKILEVLPEHKYLHRAAYETDRRFPPVVVGNTVYGWSEREGVFVKRFKETGEVIWQSGRLSRPVRPWVVGRMLYAGLESGEVVALDTASGSERFRFRADVADILPCGDGVLARLKDGTVVFHRGSRREWAAEGKAEAVEVAETAVLVRSGNRVVRLDPADGTRRWEWTAPGGGSVGVVAAVMDMVLVESGTGDRRQLAALAMSTGEPRWSSELKAGLRRAPTVVFETVVCLLQDGTVMAFGRDGRRLWVRPMGEGVSSLETQDGLVFVAKKDGTVSGLDPRDGKEVWRFALDGAARSSEGLFTVYYLGP